MRKLKLFIPLFVLILSACKQQVTSTNNAGSSTPNFTSGCQVGQWPTVSFPLNLKLSSDFTSEFTSGDMLSGYNPVEQMSNVWNGAVSSKTFFKVPMSATPNTGYTSLNSYQDGVMGVYKSYNWYSELSSSTLAITQFFGYSRSSAGLGNYIELIEADIIFNYRDYNGDYANSGSIPYTQDGVYRWDFQTVLLHEMGHFLGLCHDSGHTSIMKPYYLKTQRSLYTFDRTKITDLYVNNKNTLGSSSNSNAATVADGTFIKGRVELNKNGTCKHYINEKLVYEHSALK